MTEKTHLPCTLTFPIDRSGFNKEHVTKALESAMESTNVTIGSILMNEDCYSFSPQYIEFSTQAEFAKFMQFNKALQEAYCDICGCWPPEFIVTAVEEAETIEAVFVPKKNAQTTYTPEWRDLYNKHLTQAWCAMMCQTGLPAPKVKVILPPTQ